MTAVTPHDTAPADLLPHGQYVGAGYADGAWGQSTDTKRPAGGLSGTLRRFKKADRASDQPQAFGWIKATYSDAIEYSGMKQTTEGGIMVAAFFGVMTGGGGFAAGWFLLLTSTELFDTLFALAWIAIAAAVWSWLTLKPLRHVWRTPRDLPIIFDRNQRKVYRLLQDVQPGLKGLFKPWPIKAVTYEWDLLDAENDAQVMGSTATVTRLHRLVFVVRKSATDPTIIDHFEVGNAMAQGEDMVTPMWEHIRRFMEEGGPHLPSPGESLDGRTEGHITWWEACGEAGPFGSRYGWWWRNHPFMTLFVYHGLVLIGVGMFLLPLILHGTFGGVFALMAVWIALSINWGMGTGKWLLANTSVQVNWPQAVVDAVGRTIRIGPGWGRD